MKYSQAKSPSPKSLFTYCIDTESPLTLFFKITGGGTGGTGQNRTKQLSSYMSRFTSAFLLTKVKISPWSLILFLEEVVPLHV